MPGRSFRIARIAGIPVGVSPWWLVIVALITVSLGDSYFPEVVHGISPGVSYALGLLSALLLFASILAHEFGHAIVARRHGIEVEEIDLWLLGGVSRMRGEAHDPGDELRFALAGPAVTAAIAAVFGVALAALPASTPAVILALVEYQVLVNGMILVFNLLPAFPLDGGRVLRSLLWRRSGEIGKSTESAASVGRGFGYLMIFLGVLEFASGSAAGLWLALIGFFLVTASGQQAAGAEVQAVFSGVHASELMSSPVVSIPQRTSAALAGREYFLPYRYTAFPVVDEQGCAIGLVSLAQIEALAQRNRAECSVAEIAERDPALLVSGEEDIARLLERPAFAKLGRAVVVDVDGRPVGVVSVTDVQRALRATRLTGRATSVAGYVLPGALIAAIALPGGLATGSSAHVTASASPTWRALPRAPIAGRLGAGAIWTGRLVIVWGGVSRSTRGHAQRRSDGAAYDPRGRTWHRIPSAPTGVLGGGGHASAWTGGEMVVWAGNSPEGPSGGATYTPRTNRWRRLPKGPLGSREGYASVWTGRELLILGGHTGATATPTAAVVDPRTRSWRRLPALDVVKDLAVANGAVWDGHEAIVGARGVLIAVDPATDTFHRISLPAAMIDPRQHPQLDPIGWTGTEVILSVAAEAPSSAVGVLRYNPAGGRWRKTRSAPCAGAPQLAWIGDRLVIACHGGGLVVYTPRTDRWRTIRSRTSPLNSYEDSAIVWSGRELIVWSGTVGKPGNPTPAKGASISLG